MRFDENTFSDSIDAMNAAHMRPPVSLPPVASGTNHD
jgi:hypothetical protein